MGRATAAIGPKRGALKLGNFAAVLALVGLAEFHAAAAADDMNEFAIRGAGLVPCEAYNRERDARSAAYSVIASWMDGYITGVNQYARDTYDVASFETTELYAALVSEYCKKHPQTPVFAVINSLVKQDWNDRLRAPSQKVEVAIGGEKVFLYEEAIRQIQAKLKSRGFYRDGINGSYGPSVQDAMKAYQKSLQFKPTGFPDQATLWRLFNAPQ